MARLLLYAFIMIGVISILRCNAPLKQVISSTPQGKQCSIRVTWSNIDKKHRVLFQGGQ